MSLEFFVAVFTLSAQPDSIALVFPCVYSGGWFAGSFFSMFPCTVSVLSFLCHSASLSPYFSSPSVVDSYCTFLVFSSLVVWVGDKRCCLLSWSSLSLKYALCPWVRDVLCDPAPSPYDSQFLPFIFCRFGAGAVFLPFPIHRRPLLVWDLEYFLTLCQG